MYAQGVIKDVGKMKISTKIPMYFLTTHFCLLVNLWSCFLLSCHLPCLSLAPATSFFFFFFYISCLHTCLLYHILLKSPLFLSGLLPSRYKHSIPLTPSVTSPALFLPSVLNTLKSLVQVHTSQTRLLFKMPPPYSTEMALTEVSRDLCWPDLGVYPPPSS